MSFELLKSLYEVLDERGHKEAARAVLRDLRPLLHRHFPEPLHRVLDRYESAYLDARAHASASTGTARLDSNHGGSASHSDPTARQAMHVARMDRIDSDCMEIYERHLPSLERPPRRRVRAWHDTDAADTYATQYGDQVREEYTT